MSESKVKKTYSRKKKSRDTSDGSKKHSAARVVSAVTLVLCAVLIVLGGAFIAYSDRYKEEFIPGTKINGIDVGGMTASQVQEALKQNAASYVIDVAFRGGSSEKLKADQLGAEYQSTNEVEELLARQNRFGWLRGAMGGETECTVSSGVSSDAKTLAKTLKALPEVKKGTAPTDAKLTLGKDYLISIEPETQGDQLAVSKAAEAISAAAAAGKTSINLDSVDGAYEVPEITSDDETLRKQANKLNQFLSTTIEYHFYDGSTKTIDAKTLSKWLTKKDGSWTLKKSKVREKCESYVKNLCEKYDDIHTSWTFHSTDRGDIQCASGEKYGYAIDEDVEAAALYKQVMAGKSGEREPVYSLEKADSEMPEDYVEVDIANQHVYCYKDGRQVLSTDCVTGLAKTDRATPTGVYSIYSKEKNRTLKGRMKNGKPSYTSFVNYWMPFNGGVGLHDATWRSSFGGNIYKSSGSHGCVNLPKSAAAKLYDLVYVGMMVVVF